MASPGKTSRFLATFLVSSVVCSTVAVGSWTATLRAAEPAPVVRVCVDPAAAAEGLDPEALTAALAIEARKAGRDFRPCAAGDPAEAVRLTVRAAPAARVELAWPDGTTRTLGLEAVEPIDRAVVVARVVFGPDGPAPSLALDAGHPPAAEPAPRGLRVGAAAHVGARYDHALGQDGGAFGVELDATVTLGTSWALGVQALWEPRRALDTGGDLDATLDLGSVALVGRLALPAGPLWVRPALGAGVEWRAVAARDAGGDGRERSTDPVLLAETDLMWPVWGWLEVGVGVSARLYPTGTNWNWRDAEIFVAPRFVLGGALRVGGRW